MTKNSIDAPKKKKDQYAFSRFMYILEAAFEYFISILVAGAYLATVTNELGLSDNVTGILSSLTTLGCSFQILAIFIWSNRRAKGAVTVLHSINQLCFVLIYVVPFFKISPLAKSVIFIIMLLGAHVVNNIVQSPKINWFMTLVDDNKRGRFTANKEIISLIGGMVFSFIMGGIMDKFEADGNVKGSFIVCGITLFVLAALHTVTLLLSKEKPLAQNEKIPMKELLSSLVTDSSFIKIVLVSVLWTVAHNVTTPFLGTYMIKELGFSMTFVSILSAAYAICRSLFSRPLGKYADKRSFAKMLNICFIVSAVAFAINAFTVPSNGKILYIIYYMLYAIGMAGINSGGINLIYERVSKEKRVCALALKNTAVGLAGFATTLISSYLVKYIQANGNTFLGMNVYAQQVMSAITAILVVGVIIYLNTVVRRIPVNRDDA